MCNILLTWIPLIGQLIGLVLFWASICIGFKRFHDHGYPGWYSLASLVPAILGTAFFVIGLSSGSAVATLLGEILWGIGALIGLAQFIFIYLRIGQPGAEPIRARSAGGPDGRPGRAPARAGIHTPCTIDSAGCMGPRLRGDDKK